MKKIPKKPAAGLLLALLVFSCTYRQYEGLSTTLEDSCYPPAIAKIFITRCAVSGCHNTVSKGAAGGMDLSSWESLFYEGASGGTPVIPYRTDQSFLLNFINDGHDPDVMPQQPLMPYNLAPLSVAEYEQVKSWIADGAPDCNGRRFSDNPDRDKFYVSNQGCDLLYVFDADKRVIMRAIDVGGDPDFIESPHMIRFSPDGLYYYICYAAPPAARYFEKYRTADDALLARLDISIGGWNTFNLTPGGDTAFAIDLNGSRIAVVDCNNMTLVSNPPANPDPGPFSSPHGSRISPDGSALYVTLQLGNALFKMDANWPPNFTQYINFPTPGIAKPHEVDFSPDGSLYFVTCEGTNDVKVFDAATDGYLKSIPTAADPVEMEFVESKHLLFVSCMAGNSVSIIDYADTILVKTIVVGTQPHGLAADEKRGVVYVGNRNANPTGPAPHHVSSCGGRNGYLVAIDLNTLELVPGFKIELSVDPYSVRVRK